MTLRDCSASAELVTAGVNLAGIDRILSLEDRNAALDERNVTLEGDNDVLRAESSPGKLRKHRRSHVQEVARPRPECESRR